MPRGLLPKLTFLRSLAGTWLGPRFRSTEGLGLALEGPLLLANSQILLHAPLVTVSLTHEAVHLL